MKVTHWQSSFLCLFVILGLFPISPVRADLQLSPSAAFFSVNTNADNKEYDAYLTLREATEAANGVFKASYSPAEQLLMSGCTFDPSGKVTGGCGAGGDAILFTAAVTHIIPLNSLPQIMKDGVQFYGISGKTIIDFKSVTDNAGFRVNANSVYFYNLILINAVKNDNPTIINPMIHLWPGHKGLRVVGNYIGVTPTTTSCSDPVLSGRTTWEVYIDQLVTGTAAAGDGSAYIYENVIGCSAKDGVTIMGSSYVYVGQDPSGKIRPNYIGVTPAGDNIGNLRIGILMDRPDFTSYTLQGNVITGNQIANCAGGISVYNTNTSLISNNNIHHNGGGIEVIDSSTNTFTDNQAHHNGSSGIYFKEINGSTFGNTVNGGSSYRNTTSGIATYGNLNKNRWMQVSTYENGGLGIDLGDNGIVNAPPLVVTGVTPQSQGYLVNGTFTTSSALSTNYTIELYRSTRDASGYGEGKIYLGSATYLKSAAGTYSWSIPDPLGAICYTATLTVSEVSNPALASSSEFSANLGTQCSQVLIPIVQK